MLQNGRVTCNYSDNDEEMYTQNQKKFVTFINK